MGVEESTRAPKDADERQDEVVYVGTHAGNRSAHRTESESEGKAGTFAMFVLVGTKTNEFGRPSNSKNEATILKPHVMNRQTAAEYADSEIARYALMREQGEY